VVCVLRRTAAGANTGKRLIASHPLRRMKICRSAVARYAGGRASEGRIGGSRSASGVPLGFTTKASDNVVEFLDRFSK
jgi:hypothetical protein